jgi:hypothetical protein
MNSQNCTRNLCPATPKTDIPPTWRTPAYDELKVGWFKQDLAMCLTVDDAKKILLNQSLCDQVRMNVIDYMDAIGK